MLDYLQLFEMHLFCLCGFFLLLFLRAPHIGRADLPKRSCAVAPTMGYHERDLVDSRRSIARIANETGVVLVGNFADTDVKLVEHHPVNGTFVLTAFARPHQESAGWDSRHLWKQIVR